jgi:MinD-like ATPase involved in chromosome partitioning or flagellar assembly
VVLAVDEHEVAEEVVHFLDRAGGAQVVATAADERQLAEAVRQLEPDAVVASPSLLRRGTPVGRALLAVDTRESVGSLRTAIRAGAQGFYLWPHERDELAAASRRTAVAASNADGGRLIAVIGSRGGAGTTFLATHLAAAFARRRRDCVLIDLDVQFDDIAAALGIPIDEPVPTLTDLLADEGVVSMERRPWTHPAGFRVIPGSNGRGPIEIDADDAAAVVDATARASDVVVAHLPRTASPIARAIVARAEEVVVVLTLEVASFRAARRTVATFDVEERCRFVVNRAQRADIAVADVQRVFGRPALGVVPASSQVRGAQDRGALLPPRGRVARAVDRIAAALTEPV